MDYKLRERVALKRKMTTKRRLSPEESLDDVRDVDSGTSLTNNSCNRTSADSPVARSNRRPMAMILPRLVLPVIKDYCTARGFEDDDDCKKSILKEEESRCGEAVSRSRPRSLLRSSISMPSSMSCVATAPTNILPFLYLGSHYDAMSEQVIEDCNITHVLNVSTGCQKTCHVANSNFLRIPINDSHNDRLLPFFPQAFQFLDSVRRSNGCVLVHCLAGVSRSATVVIAFIMQLYHTSMDEAYRFVKRKRPAISPNFNFLGQLLEFETQLKSRSSTKTITQEFQSLISDSGYSESTETSDNVSPPVSESMTPLCSAILSASQSISSASPGCDDVFKFNCSHSLSAHWFPKFPKSSLSRCSSMSDDTETDIKRRCCVDVADFSQAESSSSSSPVCSDQPPDSFCLSPSPASRHTVSNSQTGKVLDILDASESIKVKQSLAVSTPNKLPLAVSRKLTDQSPTTALSRLNFDTVTTPIEIESSARSPTQTSSSFGIIKSLSKSFSANTKESDIKTDNRAALKLSLSTSEKNSMCSATNDCTKQNEFDINCCELTSTCHKDSVMNNSPLSSSAPKLGLKRPTSIALPDVNYKFTVPRTLVDRVERVERMEDVLETTVESSTVVVTSRLSPNPPLSMDSCGSSGKLSYKSASPVTIDYSWMCSEQAVKSRSLDDMLSLVQDQRYGGKLVDHLDVANLASRELDLVRLSAGQWVSDLKRSEPRSTMEGQGHIQGHSSLHGSLEIMQVS